MTQATKPSREEVLKVAGEPVAYMDRSGKPSRARTHLGETCGKLNNGHACTLPKGHKCPDCGLSLHDVGAPE